MYVDEIGQDISKENKISQVLVQHKKSSTYTSGNWKSKMKAHYLHTALSRYHYQKAPNYVYFHCLKLIYGWMWLYEEYL